MRLIASVVIAGLSVATNMLAFQTQPTPEPATALLLGAGLVAVGAVAWRKNRKK